MPASELYHDILSPTTSTTPLGGESLITNDNEYTENAVQSAVEYSLVDPESGAVVAKTDRAELNASARQTLSTEEIEALKKDGTDAGRDLIAKLMVSHTAIEQKTEYSLAKYKLLKTKKYIRRFSVLPMDVPMLAQWQLEAKEPSKILDMREEMIALLGCWANVHFGGEDRCEDQSAQELEPNGDKEGDVQMPSGRWLVVDDTGGLLVAAMAERMGLLYPPENIQSAGESNLAYSKVAKRKALINENATSNSDELSPKMSGPQGDIKVVVEEPEMTLASQDDNKTRLDDLLTPLAQSNTLTVIHANQQPNLALLRDFGFDITNPTPSPHHPLSRHLMTISWLQLIEPMSDPTYASEMPSMSPEMLRSWKANRRGTYHRKRRRWARIRHVVDTTRKGEFSGLVVASTMDPISIMRYAVPLLAGGAPIAIYSQSIEPLTALVDCYSIARRGAWVATPPEEAIGKSLEELEQWAGCEEFPLNPSLVLAASIQTSRVRKWQVLPGRTHPLMTSKGGAEGYVFTACKVKPAEGKVEARGKARTRKRKLDETKEEGSSK